MSIRLRLTLLYSAILAVTLIAFGFALYGFVSQTTIGAARTALATEARSLSAAHPLHRIAPPPANGTPGNQGQPDNGGGQGQPGNGAPAQPGGQGQPNNDGVAVDDDDVQVIVPILTNVSSQTYVQLRLIDGDVVYRSPDLKAARATLPLDAATRSRVVAGASPVTTIGVGTHRWLLESTRVTDFGDRTVVGVLQVAYSLQQEDQTLTTLRQALLLGGALVTLLAFGVGWLLAGTALRPINRITRTAREIGETRDFERRVSYGGPPDEIGRLASTFNAMLTSLQGAYQTQRRFVADASHELRTPLTTIRGNLGLLQREPPIAEADRVAVLADLVSESERLSRLVNDLLTLARSDARRVLRQEPVPIEPLVADLTRRLAVTYPDRVIHAEGVRDVGALADADALTQVLLILLDNALKFTAPGGVVTITADSPGDRVRIAVRDTGPGIAADVQSHIFERFYQGDAARTGTGTGLGLSIAKALVDAQHGTIGVESEPGRGSVFTVMLPRAPVPAPPLASVSGT